MKTILLLALFGAAAVAQDRIEDSFRKGILEEESKQNLPAAIQAYQSVLTQYDNDRKTAAAALFRMAESYRKFGKNDEAAAAYRRVVREFADQSRLVEQSRGHLPPAETAVGNQPTAESRARYRALKMEEIVLLEAHLAQLRKQVDLGAVDPNSEAMLKVKTDILKRRSELAAFEMGLSKP